MQSRQNNLKHEQWFALDTNTVMQKLNIDYERGLSSEEAADRLKKSGPNKLPEEKDTPEWIKFFKHFHDILIYILLVAAVVTFLLSHYIDTALILLVAIINAVIGYVQENRAEKALDGIKNMLSPTADIIRDERRMEIPAEELTIGDIVLLTPGGKVPADLRLIKTDNLKIEESALTGESEPVEKLTKTLDQESVLAERFNMAFSSSTISTGSGRGVVVATGQNTEIGKINKSMTETEETKTPLIRQTEQFGKTISITIVGIALIALLFGYFIQDYPLSEISLAAISLAVAAVPEGLPAIISIILAIGVQKMSSKNAIVKNLPSVETLGAVSVICSDKTGTLTQNEMTVTSLELTDGNYEVTGQGYAPEGSIEPSHESHDRQVLNQFLTAVKTVNHASIATEDGQWKVYGEPTEGCLITLADKADEEVQKLDPISSIPFDSEYKYMADLVEEDGRRRIYIKGAPDRMIDMSFDDEDDKGFWHDKMSGIAREGHRMIAAGYKDIPDDQETLTHDDLKTGVQFLGIAGIIDPPREAAIRAVEACKKAGITVKMITGDHRDTALAIADQLGIGDGKTVYEGSDIDAMTEDELSTAVEQSDIFARTSPANKLDLVHHLQHNDETVAMTGDGVNDAPALKRADIGVAMGIKGTEVTKDASRMILADDNFDTIFNAVEEGRRVYDNIKKTILFILPTNGAEALLIFAAIMMGITMPLTPVLVLWVNMVAAVTISFALAFEPLDKRSMETPPRPKHVKLLSGYYIFRIILVSLIVGGASLGVFIHLYGNGYPQEIATTATLNTIVFGQIFHLFNCRKEIDFAFNKDFFKNRSAFILSGVLIILQLLITYAPFMNDVMGTAPISLEYWVFPIGVGLATFIIIEVEKWITRSFIRS